MSIAVNARESNALPGSSPAMRTVKILGLIVIVLGVLAFVANLLVGGTKTGTALSLAVAIGPIATYLAINRPLLFPFALYVALLPFNDLVGLGQFGTLTRLLGAAAVAALIFRVLRSRSISKVPAALVAWLALGAWMTASVTWAVDKSIAWELVGTWAQLFMLYVALALVPVSEEDLKIVLGAAVVGGVAAAAYGSYLYFNGADITGNRLWIDTGNSNIDPNHYATALLLPLALVTVAALRAKNPLAWLAAMCGTAVVLSGLYLSGSRGALLGAIVIPVYFLIKTRYRLRMAAILAVAYVAGLPAGGVLGARLATAISSGGAGRWDIWGVGLDALKHYWLLGVGVGNFLDAYDFSYIHVYQPLSAGWHRAPHNLLAGTGVELGIAGLVLMLVAWYLQYAALKFIKRMDPLYDLRIALEATVLAVFISAMFLDIMYTKYTWLLFSLIVIARTYALGRIDQKRNTDTVAHPGQRLDLRPGQAVLTNARF